MYLCGKLLHSSWGAERSQRDGGEGKFRETGKAVESVHLRQLNDKCNIIPALRFADETYR